MISLLAIDPGTTQSALCYWTDGRPHGPLILSNADLLDLLRGPDDGRTLVIEEFESFGMAVGREVFRTVFWSGRFAQAFPGRFILLPRRNVKLHLCGTSRAKDPNVRAALIDRFGGSREIAIGTRKQPGPLHGFRKDCWSALALAVTAAETRVPARRPQSVGSGGA